MSFVESVDSLEKDTRPVPDYSPTCGIAMNVTKNDTNSCHYLNFDWIFYGATTLTLIFVISGFILNIILFKVTLKFGLFHANVRLLLLNFCLGNIVSCVATFGRCLYNYSLLWVDVDTVAMTRLQCVASEIMITVGQIVSLTSMATVGFERCMATIKQNSSDPETSSNTVKFICVILWFLGSGNLLLFALEIIFQCDPAEKVCYCFISISATNNAPYITAVLYIPFLCSCITSYVFVYAKNRRSIRISAKTTEHCLQDRYQIWNNAATMRMLLPNVISCAVFYTGLMCSDFFAHAIFWTYQSPNGANFLMIVIMIISMVGWLQPLLIITCDEKMKSLAIKNYSMLKYVLNYDECRLNCLRRSTKKQSVVSNMQMNRMITVVPYHSNPDASKNIIEEMWEKH